MEVDTGYQRKSILKILMDNAKKKKAQADITYHSLFRWLKRRWAFQVINWFLHERSKLKVENKKFIACSVIEKDAIVPNFIMYPCKPNKQLKLEILNWKKMNLVSL